MASAALSLAIDSQFDHVFLVGVSVRAVCTAVGFGSDVADGIELSVVEAINNCVEHAYGEAGHRIEIELRFAADTLRIGVRDRGHRLDWRRASARADAYQADAGAEGGRGLFIIRSLMDAVDYVSRDGLNELVLVKHLRPLVRADAASGASS